MDAQVDLFPHATPETVLAYCRRLEAKVLEVAPELTESDCRRILAELSLTTLVTEKISYAIRTATPYLRRTSLPDVIPITAARGERIVQPSSPSDPPPPPIRWPRRRAS